MQLPVFLCSLVFCCHSEHCLQLCAAAAAVVVDEDDDDDDDDDDR